MAVGYGALRERYTSDVELDPAARTVDVIECHKGKKGAPSRYLENHWHFTPTNDGYQVEFSILFEVKSRLLHDVAGRRKGHAQNDRRLRSPGRRTFFPPRVLTL